ncbi:MAG: PIN domain-containing protein [Phototrophicales bacterium]|nr:PIN domain-containing protein [Phototrophicales bacterium]
MIGIVDTTVIVHLLRKYQPALAWYDTQPQPVGLTPVTWMEVMYGAGSKAKQAFCKTLLSEFTLLHIGTPDQDWAMGQMERFRLSHGITTNDCLIASVAYRLQIPLYTHNLKDMTPMIGNLAIKPYA